MDYWARDTTQSNFGIAYTALCQQVNEFSRAMAESNMNASNSMSQIESKINQCCCNIEQAKTMVNLGMQNLGMRVEEQTVEHYVPGLSSPFVTRQMVMQAGNDELEKKINDLMIQNMQGKIYDSLSRKTVPVEPKKYTIYDLYDLTFPDDPIKKHFITVCNNIEKEYQKKKEVLDQIEAPEVRTYHVEPIPTVTIDDHPILDDIACALAAVIILSMATFILYGIFFIVL